MSYAGPLYTFYVDYNDGSDHLGTLITHSPDVQPQIDRPVVGQVVIAHDPNISDWFRYAVVERTHQPEDGPMWMQLKMLEDVPLFDGSCLIRGTQPNSTAWEDRPDDP